MHYSFKKYLFLTGWLCICLNTNSQNSYLSFSHIGVEQGLSDMKVNTIVQDNLGFIWLGTDFGLNRYDGHNFFPYKNEPENIHSLSSNIISALFVDSKGNIWIGTDKGLNFYDYTSGKIYRFEKSSFAKSQIKAINIDSDQKLVVATTDHGLFIGNLAEIISGKKSKKEIQFKQLDINRGLSDNNVRAIHKDKKDNLWIGTNNGLNFYNAEYVPINNNQVHEKIYTFFENKKINTISSSTINNNEIIWVGTSNGLYYFNKKDTIINAYFNEKSLSFNKNYILKVLTQNDTTIWVGALSGGIKKIDYFSKKVEINDANPDDERSIASNLIATLFIDNNELIWIGAGGSGLDVANTGKNVFTNYLLHNYSYKRSLRASSFIEDLDKNLLIATYHGIIKYNRKKDQITTLIEFLWVKKEEKPSLTQKILRDKRGNFWIATFGNGLFLYDKNLKLIKNYKNESNVKNSLSNNYIYSIYLDKQGLLYIGTRNGLNILNPKTNIFEIYKSEPNNPNALTNPFITALGESKGGTMWIGSWGGGIYKFNKNTLSFENFKFNKQGNQTLNNNIAQLLPDSDSILWLATANGVKKFNTNTQQTKNYTVENGLQSRVTNGLILKNKKLWISTGLGISVLSTETDKILNYRKSNNLLVNDLIRQSQILHSDGDIYFGGSNGFVKINTDNEDLDKEIYRTFVSNFFILGKSIGFEKGTHRPVYIMDTISISTSDKLIRFELTTPCYQNQDKLKYKYKLEGFNEEFIELGETEASIGFTNLEYGNYRLIVKTANPSNIWGQSQILVTLIVKPRIWQTTWFKIVSVFLVIILVYSAYRRRLINIRKHNEKLKLLVKQKTKELETSMEALFEQKEKLSVTNIQLEEKKEEITEQAEELIIISEKLRESNITLEKKVESRTKDLNSALLKADDARRLISAFLENMSHEVRTPMNAISGFSQLIAQEDLPAEKMAKYSDIIIKNIDSLLDLISNIMDASKLHAGQYKFAESTFDLNSLFKSIYDKLINEKALKKEKVNCSIVLPVSDNFMLHSDQSAFMHVIYNLLENALKYTENGSVEFGYILVKTHHGVSLQEKTNGQYKINAEKPDFGLEIFVKDTGIGIAKKEQEIIFDLFQKLESSKEKLYRGSGLGLAIVNNLSVKLHAKITLKSKINSGTYISLTIPLSEV